MTASTPTAGEVCTRIGTTAASGLSEHRMFSTTIAWHRAFEKSNSDIGLVI
jgi:hypothetical protein